MKILLVEDDAFIAMGLKYALAEEGYDVVHCPSVLAYTRLENRDFDLALLDVGLPDGTGFDIAQLLRCPFIFLTATDDEANTVRGFDLGADDYVNKPFRLKELMARIKVALRRGKTADIIHIGDIAIDKTTMNVTQNGDAVDLTALEYKLMLVFAENIGRTLTRGQLLDKLWDNDGNFVEDNTLSVYIRRLREKLGSDFIQTVRGLGYVCKKA
ncbi:DNA-binding response regulator [Clostridia bacterium]|nr:DNA-binding response regulator [Clostridia bacterium]